ncbi:MAG TPA: cyclic nucleotide-binding domain-containing protein, partial [Nitratifractor sp.]|nr:cyclic nucleotide-binding domain-containing protein [Nitratifractor sp.]
MAAFLKDLQSTPPFNKLDASEIEAIEKTAQIAYYPDNTVLIEKGSVEQKLYYIIKGVVEARDGDELIDLYQEHDTLFGAELLGNQVSKYQYSVAQELICYEIPYKTFKELAEQNSAFRDYFIATIAKRIDTIKEKSEFASLGQLMTARLDTIALHSATIVKANT